MTVKIRPKKKIKKKTKIKNTDKEIKLQLTNPNKILYPEGKITKLAVAEYYQTVQNWILPYIVDRPLTLVRCPNNYTQCFYQKHLDSTFPPGLFGIMIKEKEGSDRYIYLKDALGLAALTQLGVLEIHPWGSRIERVEYPDWLIFDLDPAPGVPWKEIVKAAFRIKDLLTDLKLKSFVKTTGGKGLHVVAPIQPQHRWDDVKNFSHGLVEYLVSHYPDQYIAVMTKAKRVNKIYVDYLRNQRGATSVAPYSTRARKNAPVSTPIDWDELTNDIRDTFFTLETVPKRLVKMKKDPWANFLKTKQFLKLDKLK